MKIALYGGSFDPIHRGHLEAAHRAATWLGLDRVVFLPARRPPHKLDRNLASPFDRYALIAASIVDQPWAELSAWELEREGTTYAIEQLEAFESARPEDRVVLMIGADSLADFPQWRRADEIASRWGIAALPRSPWSWSSIVSAAPAWLAPRLRFFEEGEAPSNAIPAGEVWGVPLPAITISSTELRRRMAAGESVDDDIPAGAAELIRRHGLYRRARQP